MKKSVRPDPDKTLKTRLESQPLTGENAAMIDSAQLTCAWRTSR